MKNLKLIAGIVLFIFINSSVVAQAANPVKEANTTTISKVNAESNVNAEKETNCKPGCTKSCCAKKRRKSCKP